jgi:hypothetical protein
MGIASRINHDEIHPCCCGELDPVDQGSFGITLKGFQLNAGCRCPFAQSAIDFRKGEGSIMGWLTSTQKVEIRAMHHKYLRHNHQFASNESILSIFSAKLTASGHEQRFAMAQYRH